jgi:hypothetical protein
LHNNVGSLDPTRLWFLSRPRPAKRRDTTAIVADGTPGFAPTDDGKKIRFKYSLEYKTDSDHQIASGAEIKLVVYEISLSKPAAQPMKKAL